MRVNAPTSEMPKDEPREDLVEVVPILGTPVHAVVGIGFRVGTRLLVKDLCEPSGVWGAPREATSTVAAGERATGRNGFSERLKGPSISSRLWARSE